MGPDGLAQLRPFTVHADTRVRVAGVEAIAETRAEGSAELLVSLLGSPDPVVASAAADGIVEARAHGARPAGLVEGLQAALLRTSQLRDPSLAVSVLDAIGALGPDGRPLLKTLAALEEDVRPAIRRRAAAAQRAISGQVIRIRPKVPDAGRPAPLLGRHRIAFETTRGTIVIELLGEIAPRAVGTVLSLAESGFYTDKTFHRVVSDYVIQGGCPRGDGYGGPGYAIEEEVSELPFVRGAVGLATAGRDTGGSQLFVMQSYHPHLDGSYTLFGHVVEGMDVVDAIQQDDRILRVGARAQP
jgi:cyclophilin family peptidyl-prolyl cis-trans isomerase